MAALSLVATSVCVCKAQAPRIQLPSDTVSTIRADAKTAKVAKTAPPSTADETVIPDGPSQTGSTTKLNHSGGRVPARTTTEPPKSTPLSWLDQLVFKRIDVTGRRSIGYHLDSVSGDTQSYQTLNYYGQGDSRFTSTGTMNLAGKQVLGLFDFQMSYADNSFQDPDSQRVTANYHHGPLQFSAGDIQGSLLNTNQFASFNKNLKGVVSEFDSGRLRLKAVESQTKGSARTVSIQGDNTTGPYYMQSGRVLSDSIAVQVDGQPMKLSTDFVLDAEVGSITFTSRTIPTTSTIVVTFEAYNANQSTGVVQGAGLAYDMGKAGAVGFTAMQQLTGGSNNNSITQSYQGFGDPSSFYYLDYAPNTLFPVIISVDGQVLTSAEYQFDTNLPTRFRILFYVQPTQLVTVVYHPVATQTVNGDRRVLGFDYTLPLGAKSKAGYLKYSLAQGQVFNTDEPSTALARGLQGQYKYDGITFRGNYRNIPGNFVSVETMGFTRNEDAYDLGADWTRGRFTYNVTQSNSSVISQTATATNATGYQISRVTNLTGSARYSDASGTTWSLTQSHAVSRVTDETRIDTTSFSGTRDYGKLKTNFGLTYENGEGPISNGSTSQVGSLDMESANIGARYALADKLSLDSRISFSNMRLLGQQSQGTDMSLSTSYKPSSHWTLSGGYTLSDSGQLATLGTLSNGSGLGYSGNGFSSGAVGDLLATTASTAKQYNLTAMYKASDRFSLTTRYFDTNSTGSLTTNADTRTYGAAAEWDLGKFTLIGGSIDRSQTSYFGTVVGSTSGTTAVLPVTEVTSYSFFLNASPKGRWSYHLGMTGLLSTGTAQSLSTTFDTNVAYRLSSRQRLMLSYLNGNSNGTYGQLETSAAFSYEYQIYKTLSLVGSYRSKIVQNADPIAVTTGAYRAHGLGLELAFDFQQ